MAILKQSQKRTLSADLRAAAQLLTLAMDGDDPSVQEALAAIEKARRLIDPPKRPRKIWTERGLVDVPQPGLYRDPTTGTQYKLFGFLGFCTVVNGWGGSSGWPTNWQDLELVELFPEED